MRRAFLCTIVSLTLESISLLSLYDNPGLPAVIIRESILADNSLLIICLFGLSILNIINLSGSYSPISNLWNLLTTMFSPNFAIVSLIKISIVLEGSLMYSCFNKTDTSFGFIAATCIQIS